MPAQSENALAKFTVEKSGAAYRVYIEDDAGESMQLSATPEQLELLADTLDELLGADDTGTANEGDEQDDQ